MGAPILGVAMGVPEIAKGFSQAGKDMKQEQKRTNKYDAIMEPDAPDVPKIAKTIDVLDEKNAEDKKKQSYYLKSYGIPASLIAAALIRGRMVHPNNYLQLGYDSINLAKKVVPNTVDTLVALESKNPRFGTKGKFVAQTINRANQNAKKQGGGLGQGLAWGAGMVGGGAAAEYGISKIKNRNKNPKYAEESFDFEKDAGEIPNTPFNHVRKIVREGILHPSLYSIPIYITPAAISYAINKDIKTDFSPVRDLSDKKKREKLLVNSSQTDLASLNNATLNREFAKIAAFKKMSPTWKRYFSGKDPFVKSEKPPIKIKEWKDLPEDSLISGLRAASMAVPITLLAQSDPIQQIKNNIRADAMKQQQLEAERAQKRELKKAVRTAVTNEVSKKLQQNEVI